MKKIMAVLFSAVLALSLSVSVYAEDDNIALKAAGAVITASSESSGQPLSNINDGDASTYWESSDASNPSEWVSLTWEDAQSISGIKMLWGGGKPSAGNGAWAGYSAIEYSADGETFKPLSFSVERASNPNDTNGLPYTDTISWSDGELVAKSVRINFAQFAMNGAYQCYEIQVYGEKFTGDIPSDTPSDVTSETVSDEVSSEASSEAVSSEAVSSEAVSSEAVSSDAASDAVSSSQPESSDAASQTGTTGGNGGSPTVTVVIVVAAVIVIAVVAVIIAKKKKA